MPYHIGEKGSNGCSGYPVVSDEGHVAGCHGTEAEAGAQVRALYANVPDASKSETPMDVAYNAVVTDPTPATPSSNINPGAGMKKPQYMMNFGRQIGSGIKDKRVVDIWTVKADAPMPENPIMPTQTYEGCECDYCTANELTCSQCPQCGGMDGEREMAAYDASLGKSDETPQEQPQEPAKPESFFNFRDMRATRNTVRLGE
jgi:hypothetical protein